MAARFKQQHRQLAFSRLRVLHANQNGSTGLTAGIDLLDDSFSHLPERLSDAIPHQRHFTFITGGLSAAAAIGAIIYYATRTDHDLVLEPTPGGGAKVLVGGRF